MCTSTHSQSAKSLPTPNPHTASLVSSAPEAPRLDDSVKQLPACCILHHDAQVRGREVQLWWQRVWWVGGGTGQNRGRWQDMRAGGAPGWHRQVLSAGNAALCPAGCCCARCPNSLLLLTSLNETTFALSSMRWLMISRSTFLSICESKAAKQDIAGVGLRVGKRGRLGTGDSWLAGWCCAEARQGGGRVWPHASAASQQPPPSTPVHHPHTPTLTRSPRSMNFTATSSLVTLLRISLATPKLPEPMSRICGVGVGVAGCRKLSTGGNSERLPAATTGGWRRCCAAC
jgi:hypothetical protein